MTYIGVVTESLNLLGGQGGSKGTNVLEDGVGIGSDGLDSRVHGNSGVGGGSSLELDNVLVLNDLSAGGGDERSTLLDSRSGSCQRQEGEKNGGTHFGC